MEDNTNTPETQATIDEAVRKLVNAYEEAYVGFMNTLNRLPIDQKSRNMANQFFDSGSLWIVNGIKRAVIASLSRPTPPEPEAPSAPIPEPMMKESIVEDDAA